MRTEGAAPVGVFDSGVGGLSVLRAIRQALPGESLVYCADSRYAPYGARSDAFLIDRSLAIGHWLVAQGAKALVVACNTATTVAIAALRAALTVPIVGVEPGIKPASQASRSRVAGVLATAATLRSDKFQHLLATHAGDCRLVCVAGVGLVEAIERGDTGSPTLAALLEGYLQPMLDAGADTLALGCTHYPFLIPLIRSLTGERLRIIDNSMPVARQLGRLLDARGLRAPAAPVGAAPSEAALTLLSTGSTHALDGLARVALSGTMVPAAVRDIPSVLSAADGPYGGHFPAHHAV
ncbi:glutamate racemase [Robbsia sp. Bb-Pol-6]|uniref:Glutamate racemase n=1 Tax=Robbsia betulipollinis TaxID=2981849 RepID=A0ABT3ZMR7_9BURK|nr:glutamate racemase [Robbsia betulipollinis]MCY0387796.1 glutamate racemase [Robbsia betulipollinis]